MILYYAKSFIQKAQAQFSFEWSKIFRIISFLIFFNVLELGLLKLYSSLPNNSYRENYLKYKLTFLIFHISKKYLSKNEAKKIKINNFTGNNKEQQNISIVILEKQTIGMDRTIFVGYFGCTIIIFVNYSQGKYYCYHQNTK